VDDLRVEAGLVGIDVVALGSDEVGGCGDVVGFGGAVGGDCLLGISLALWTFWVAAMCTFVSASGSMNRCLPRDFTNVLDLCASTATLRSDVVLPAFLRAFLCPGLDWSFPTSSFGVLSSCLCVKSIFFGSLRVVEKHRVDWSVGLYMVAREAKARRLVKPLMVVTEGRIIAKAAIISHGFARVGMQCEEGPRGGHLSRANHPCASALAFIIGFVVRASPPQTSATFSRHTS
jgi:hypothetical protein